MPKIKVNKAERPCINCQYQNSGSCNNVYECAKYQVFLTGEDASEVEDLGTKNIELMILEILG